MSVEGLKQAIQKCIDGLEEQIPELCTNNKVCWKHQKGIANNLRQVLRELTVGDGE